MSRQEREDFLGEVHVGVLAVERPDGPPLMTPVWYRYSPGDVIEFNTERTSEKTALLERSGQASLCVQREELPYAYVTVDGVVEIDSTDRATRVDIARRLERRWAPPTSRTARCVVRIQPRRWRTSDFSKLDLPDS